jgi:hypothetical protein
MTAATLLKTLQSRGVTVRADGDTLWIKPFRLARDLDAAIRDNKSAILELLAAGAPDSGTQSTLSGVPDSDSDELAARQAQHARILEVFPEAQPARGRRWVIEGETYDHENAVRLTAYRSGITTNGYPISIDVGAVYRVAQAAQSTLSEASAINGGNISTIKPEGDRRSEDFQGGNIATLKTEGDPAQSLAVSC